MIGPRFSLPIGIGVVLVLLQGGEQWNAQVRTAGGDPAAGTIFYDKGEYVEGWRYLEMAPMPSSIDLPWSSSRFRDIETSEGLGAGWSNTQSMASADLNLTAATWCLNLSLDGKSDWYLPSKDELELLYRYLIDQGRKPGSDLVCWTSSQESRPVAWIENLATGFSTIIVKSNEIRAWPVRRF